MKFDEFKLNTKLNKAISDAKYITPTPIQEQAIPHILQGNDLLGLAQTGTGKTAAFVLPILQLILSNPKETKLRCPRVVILAPTRELSMQIGENICKYSKYTSIKNLVLFGGRAQDSKDEQLKEAIEILVTTPGKLLALLDNKLISLEELDYLVFDEADKIIESGLRVDLKKIIRKLPYKRQTLFFSATMSKDIKELANELLKKPIKVEISEDEINLDLITQYALYVQPENKEKLLLELIYKKEVKSAIIFTNSKRTADDVVRLLTANNIKSEALHSNKSNTHREKVINNIKSRKIKYLIATDLASRGLDIDNITHIINYDMPTKPQDYVHRIGRTARKGLTGIAFSICLRDDKLFLNKIEKDLKIQIQTLRHTFHSELARNASGKKIQVRNKVKQNGRTKDSGVKNKTSQYKNKL